MTDTVESTPAPEVQVETKSKKPVSYTVEISQFENGQFNPVKIPCTIVRENETSYRVRVRMPNGEEKVIRKNKSKVFSSDPKVEKPPKEVKKEEVKKDKPKKPKKKYPKVQEEVSKKPRKSKG